MSDGMAHNECDLLVLSTDSYLQEASLTVSQLKKNQFTELFDCYLLAGEADVHLEDFKMLRRKHLGTWSSELRDGLLQLHKPYVFIWLDDLVPIEFTNRDKIVELIDGMIGVEGNYLRMHPLPFGNGSSIFSGATIILPGELYRASMVLAVWRRETLLSLLRDDESAWQFEFSGSVRSNELSGFFVSNKAYIKFVNLVIKGKVDPRAEMLLQKNLIDTAKIDRNRMSFIDLCNIRLKDVRSQILRFFPWKYRSWIRHMFSINPKSM